MDLVPGDPDMYNSVGRDAGCVSADTEDKVGTWVLIKSLLLAVWFSETCWPGASFGCALESSLGKQRRAVFKKLQGKGSRHRFIVQACSSFAPSCQFGSVVSAHSLE